MTHVRPSVLKGEKELQNKWLFCLPFLFIACGDAHAESLVIRPSLIETGVWDSNPLMRSDGARELYGVLTASALSISKQTQISQVDFYALVENAVYNQDDFDTTDFHGSMSFARKTQRTEIALRLAGDYDTTRVSELSNFGSDASVVRHVGYTVSPKIAYKLSERNNVEFSANYLKSAYDDASYVDYHTISFAPAVVRKLTELSTGSLSISVRRYQTDEGQKKITDSFGPSLGYTGQVAPNLLAQARVGATATREEVSGNVTKDWSWSTVYAGDLTYKGDLDTLTVSASRAQQSYGKGDDSFLTSIGMKENRNITPALSLQLGTSYQFADEKNNTTELDTMISANAGISYRLTGVVNFGISYRYKQETYTNGNSDAKQSVARLGLTFRPNIDGI